MRLCTILLLLVISASDFYSILTRVSAKKLVRNWGEEGVLSFYDEFDTPDVRKDLWDFGDWCAGKGSRDTNLECFTKSDENIRQINSSLILTAKKMTWREMKLYAKPRNFTSGRLRSKPVGFTHGAFVIRAKLPKGKHLLPTISLLPAYQDHDDCKYEEIDIMQARGQKTSNLIFAAQYGRRWNIVAVRKKERAFPGVDFSEEFHEYAIVWKPLRIDWYLDGALVYTATTHFHSDWLLPDESNLPCSKNKGLFKQQMQLNLGLSIGGNMFPETRFGSLTPDNSEEWPKPTFEIDWVKVYQY